MSESVKVGIIGPARGLKGEMLMRPTTDYPEQRFAPGAEVETADGRVFTVAGSRVISNRLCVFFDEVATREAAEALRGEALFADPLDDGDGYYAAELDGLAARTPDGKALGTVTGIQTGPAQDLLAVRTPAGALVLVPFVEALVPTVDVAGGTVTIDAPEGLFPNGESA